MTWRERRARRARTKATIAAIRAAEENGLESITPGDLRVISLARTAHPSRLEVLAEEVDRRAALVDKARTETPWSPSTAGQPMSSRTAAIYSVLDDLHAGRLW